MKKKTPIFPRLAVAAFLSAHALHAETITLKSGRQLEGKIVRQTATELILSVQVTPTIADEIIVRKADVKTIATGEQAQEEKDWSLIARYEIGTDSLAGMEYAQIIQAFDHFLGRYPGSSHAAAAKEKVAKFREEQRRVDWGETKIDGKWLSAEEVQAEKYQISGRMAFRSMRRFVAESQWTDAMNAFDALEKRFPGCSDYPNAVEVAGDVLGRMKSTAESALAAAKAKADSNAAHLKTLKGTQRREFEAKMFQERKAIDTAAANAARTAVKWPPLQPASEMSLRSLISKINAESNRLAALPIAKMTASMEAAMTARKLLAAGDLPGTEAALTEASSLWQGNEVVPRLRKNVAEVKAAKAKAALGKQGTESGNSPAPKK